MFSLGKVPDCGRSAEELKQPAYATKAMHAILLLDHGLGSKNWNWEGEGEDSSRNRGRSGTTAGVDLEDGTSINGVCSPTTEA